MVGGAASRAYDLLAYLRRRVLVEHKGNIVLLLGPAQHRF